MQTSSNPHTLPARLSYTLGEFCAATGLSRTAAYQAIASGELASFKFGKRRYIRASAAEAWLSTREEGSRGPIAGGTLIGRGAAWTR